MRSIQNSLFCFFFLFKHRIRLIKTLSIISEFYEAFAQGDAEVMVSFYSDDIVFTDPAFGILHGNEAKNMWRMLIEQSRGELKITFGGVHANENYGSANWTAHYTFGQTGRKITNHISATFEIESGKIIKHTDHFSLWRWSSQALGLKGYLLGWTPFMRSQIQKQTNALLKAYSRKHKQHH